MKIISIPLRTALSMLTIATLANATNLANFLNTRSNVDHFADISRDMRDMSENCDNNNPIEAETIYIYGKNSPYSDKPGHRSFQKFSQDRAKHLDTLEELDPTFAFQMYGMTEGGNMALLTPALANFADLNAMAAFANDDCNLAVDYAGVHSLWPEITKMLWDAIAFCDTYQNTEDGADELPTLANRADEFIAMYIGSVQSATDSTDGYSLYSLAQIAGSRFGDDGVVASNMVILEKYDALIDVMSQTNACEPESTTVARMWDITNQIISAMTLPIMQLLVEAYYREDQDLVTLYGTIIVGQLSQCRQSTYKFLRQMLLENEVDKRNIGTVFDALVSAFDCLGISCDDFGVYNANDTIQCDAAYMRHMKLAEYDIDSSEIAASAKIDVDIHQIEMLMSYESPYTWQMANLMYQHGKSRKNTSFDDDDDDFDDDDFDDDDSEDVYSGKTLSLKDMATSSERDVTTIYSTYQQYFNHDANYAHKVIAETFNNEGKWGAQRTDKKAAIISGTMRTSVLWMHIVTMMEVSYKDCIAQKSGGNFADLDSWDEVAANVIGSFEGPGKGGSDNFEDGKLLWNLGNVMAPEFGRANADGDSRNNDQIMILLLAGRGMLETFSCDSLKNVIERLRNLLMIPVLQAVLKYAVLNEMEPSFDGDVNVALGEAYAYAALPLIDLYDTAAAITIKKNMVVERIGNMVPDGPQKVADAVNTVVRFFGVECEYIGKIPGADTCKNYKPNLQDKDKDKDVSSASIISMVVPGALLIVSSFVMMF